MTPHAGSYLFLGDCNTLGFRDQEGNCYPEQVCRALNVEVKNCGHTMSTVREGLRYFEHYYSADTTALFIQFGLVDSWRTIKYSPYALYYPEHPLRKIARKILKKYKKIAKKLGLNKLFGEENVVSVEEYQRSIQCMVERAQNIPCFLIETLPNRESFRNPEIQKYNAVLAALASEYDHVYLIKTYDDFVSRLDKDYADNTHLSGSGVRFLTGLILNSVNASKWPI